MTVLIIVLIAFGLCRLFKVGSPEAQRRSRHRQAAREKRRSARIKEQQRLFDQQVKEQQRINRETAAELIAQRKEQERLAKEQERQAVLLAKHEDQIAKLEQVVRKSSADIAFLQERSAELYAQLDYVLLLQAGTVPGSTQHTKYQSKIVTLHNQIHAAESKLSRAQYQREQANKILSA